MNKPIFRAKQTYEENFVEGSLVVYGVECNIRQNNGAYLVVDESSIEISFNNGDKWFSLERVNYIMDGHVNCTICNDTGINHHNQPKPGKWKSIPCKCGAKK